MSYHHCPIEPSDWTDGPDYLEGDDCDRCGGTGFHDENAGISCSHCDGNGYLTIDDYDPTDFWND